MLREQPYGWKSLRVEPRRHAVFNAAQSDFYSDHIKEKSAFKLFENARALRKNLRNTADVSDTLQSILGILKNNSCVEHDPQKRGHFIHGPRVTIHVITFHKKEFEHQICEFEHQISPWLYDFVQQDEKKNKIKGISTQWIFANTTKICNELWSIRNKDLSIDQIASTEFSSVAIVFGLDDKPSFSGKQNELFDKIMRDLYTAVSRATVYCRVFFIYPILLNERDDLVQSEQPDSNSTSLSSSSSNSNTNILQKLLLEFERNGQDNLELRDRLRGPRIRRHKFQVQKKYRKVQMITKLPHQQVIEWFPLCPHLAEKSPNEPTQEDFLLIQKTFFYSEKPCFAIV